MTHGAGEITEEKKIADEGLPILSHPIYSSVNDQNESTTVAAVGQQFKQLQCRPRNK